MIEKDIKRIYEFVWIKNSKYGKEIERHNQIILSKSTGDPKYDAKDALQIFIGRFGNLNKNKIVCIKEFDESGNQIGEDIVPAEGNMIIPEKKKER